MKDYSQEYFLILLSRGVRGVCPLRQGCINSVHLCQMVKASSYQTTKNKAHRNGFYHPASLIYSISRRYTALNCIKVWFYTSTKKRIFAPQSSSSASTYCWIMSLWFVILLLSSLLSSSSLERRRYPYRSLYRIQSPPFQIR